MSGCSCCGDDSSHNNSSGHHNNNHTDDSYICDCSSYGCCGCCGCSCSEYCPKLCIPSQDCQRQCYGRLSSRQRLAFLVCCLLAVVGNVSYIGYALAKVQYAYDHPTVSVSEERWTQFPAWSAIITPIVADDDLSTGILGTSRSSTSAAAAAIAAPPPSPPPPRRPCPFTNATCTVYRDYPLANNGDGTTSQYRDRWTNSGIDCSSLLAGAGGSIQVPSTSWIGFQSDNIDIDPQLGVYEVTLDVLITVNKTSVDTGVCSRLEAMIVGWGDAVERDSDGTPMHVALPEPPVSLIIGNGARIMIQSTAHKHMGSPNRFYEVKASGVIDTGPLRSSSSSSSSSTTNTVRIVFSASGTMTSEFVTVSTESVSYDYDDAIAAILAVANTTVTALALIFPMTPLIVTVRLCMCDRSKYTDASLNTNTNTSSNGNGTDLRLTQSSSTTSGGAVPKSDQQLPSVALLSAEAGGAGGGGNNNGDANTRYV